MNFLVGHGALKTRDPDEVARWLSASFAVRHFDLPDSSRQFSCVINSCQLSSISLTYLDYGAPVSVVMDQFDCFVQGIPLSGSGNVSALGKDVIVGKDYGTAAGPGTEMKLEYGDGFRHLALRIAPNVLSAKLAAMIGQPVDPPVMMAGPSGNHDLLAAQARLVRLLIGELDNRMADFAPLMLAELEQAILVSYLEAYEHNYSHLLRGKPRAAAPWQVKRAVDFIEAHWNEPITIEALSAASQTSARSLFHLFRRTYGYSPMVYVNRVRLRHARDMLMRPEPGMTVTGIGIHCGFSNLGTFAQKYRQAFGENPSDTLRHHR